MAVTEVHRPMHRQIFERIHREIVGGEYRPGDKLPTEAELMEEFSVSRTTVQQALRRLQVLGMLDRRQGSGSYVLATDLGEQLADFGFFAPFIETERDLPYVEGLIHHRLSSLASQHHANMHLQCVTSGDKPLLERMKQSAQALIDRPVKGVLYYPAMLPPDQMVYNRQVVDMLQDAGIAVVLIDRDVVDVPHRSDLTRIGYDNQCGGFLLAEHLIQLGCRRIAFVGTPTHATSVTDRMEGYLAALRTHGIADDSQLIQLVDKPTAESTRQLMETARPDAVICAMDRFAALVGRHSMIMGLQIGKDIKLAGFDDDPIAELLHVPLTTIRLPAGPFADAAFQAIQEQIRNPELAARQIIINIELIVRESTAG